jgi:hypothetical protein
LSITAEPEKLKPRAMDLTKEYPRSPRETLAGYIIAPRALDKCRAKLNGTEGEYLFDFFMDRQFFEFTGIKAKDFTAFVATGATDEEVADWITKNSQIQDPLEIVKWNNKLRYTTPKEMPDRFQLFMEDYITLNLPRNRPVYFIFDIFDIEEGRL